MASKGGKKHEKRLVSSKIRKLSRKHKKWTIRSKPGPNTRKKSVPLGFVLRDLIGVTSNARETKLILTEGKVELNGKTEKDHRIPVGLFDLIYLKDLDVEYRMLFDQKGRLYAEESKKPEKDKTKLVKVVNKKVTRKAKIILITNDGRTIESKDSKIKVGTTLKISIPEQKILTHLKLEKGQNALIIGGKHSGETSKISEISEGTIRRPKLVSFEGKNGKFKTVVDNVFVVEGVKK